MDCSFQGSDNKIYHLSELEMGDLTDALPLWVQFRPYERFQRLKGKLPDEQFKIESDKLLSQCAAKTLTVNSPEVVAAQADDIEGSLFLIYVSLKRNHPDIGFDKVKSILSPRNIAEAAIKLRVMSGELTEETAKKKLAELAEISTKG